MIDNMIKRLMDVFAKRPDSNVSKLLAIIRDEMAKVDETQQRMTLWKDIDQAEGTTLDQIGRNVVQPRGAATDEVYRILIKSKIARNLSKGDINTVIRVIAVAVSAPLNEIEIREKFNDPIDPEPATLSLMRLPLDRVNASGISLQQFARIIQRTVAAGVRVDAVELAGTFAFGAIGDESDPDSGFADILQNTGGRLGAVLQPGEDTDLPI
ncbi:hypothetical protein PAECIP111893_00256 [Paenibacillus plantiphilus]|uniref:DUF2612 domain-containing protein n=1 Tax=Paenibacillus plantiphilus TaxID=2905650 RepID=A0ABM9BNZ4_9BACL|nr:hypothetical protein [Paenibacillus plantiphilus]CAH1190282.1 hypothetical protein PAECIP111893_00256 [Paenibacillus plantiphilus]